ncbi:MAG: hypothetical protein R2748_24960 [Bryobacterales bacterium]
MLDNTLLVMVHEHAEANAHKNSGLAVLVAGGVGGLKKGRHSRIPGTIGDLYLTLASEVMKTRVEKFPTAYKKLDEIA